MESGLKDIRKLTKDYTLPTDSFNSYRELYERLEELEKEVITHIHLESNILHEKLEKKG